MKRRDDFDEREFRVRSRSPEPQEGTLFAEIQPPSVPVSSSEAGAEKGKSSVTSQCNAILVALRAAGCVPGSTKYLSREELSVRLGIPEHILCARLGPSGPILVPKGQTVGPWPIQAYNAVCVSSSGVRVIGYALTTAGVREADRLAKRQAA